MDEFRRDLREPAQPAGPGGGATEVPAPLPWWRRKLRVVPVIIAINVVVFLAWQAAGSLPAVRSFMVVNFLVSPAHLAHGLYWTLLTSAFSHAELWHLAINMIVLYSFGAVLERLWGVRDFAYFYLAAGVFASASHCAVSLWVLGQPGISALGASGAVSGLLMAYAIIFPRHKILIMGLLPVPAAAGVVAFVAFDIWGLIAQTRGGGLPIGHGAHLGGAAAGAVLYLLFIRPRLQPGAGLGGPPMLTRSESRELKRLHEKVRQEGPEALTDEERAFLLRLRDRMRPTGG